MTGQNYRKTNITVKSIVLGITDMNFEMADMNGDTPNAIYVALLLQVG